jgi:transcriptional regulator with XRE-family HTH domain
MPIPTTAPAHVREVIGQRLRILRQAHGLSQDALASAVHTTQASVSEWERGRKLPGLPAQRALAEALRTDRAHLFAEVI